MYKAAKRELYKKPDAVILTFNLFPQIGIPMRLLKRRFPESTTCCLLADLPIDDKTDRGGLSKLLRHVFDWSTIKSMKACENYIVLNSYVAEKYLPAKPYIVVDGGIEEDEIQIQKANKSAHKNVLFSGALTEYNGIARLLEAMKLVQHEDVVLDIYGDGYLEKKVEQAAKTMKNVCYHGKVENTVILEKQREAWLLINPRVINDPISRVTFPSKTFEYLLSGTPVLSTRLNGYGNEYEGKLFFSDSDSPEALAKAIDEIAELDPLQLELIAKDAREFVIREKTWKSQTKKVMDFFETIKMQKNDKNKEFYN